MPDPATIERLETLRRKFPSEFVRNRHEDGKKVQTLSDFYTHPCDFCTCVSEESAAIVNMAMNLLPSLLSAALALIAAHAEEKKNG